MKNSHFPPHFTIKDGIHGLGVFTTLEVKKGTALFTLKGDILTNPTRTSIQIGETEHIEDDLGAHVNHSCTPSAKIDRATHALVSVRDIKKDEEITFDYHENEDILAAPFKCACCNKQIMGRKIKII